MRLRRGWLLLLFAWHLSLPAASQDITTPLPSTPNFDTKQIKFTPTNSKEFEANWEELRNSVNEWGKDSEKLLKLLESFPPIVNELTDSLTQSRKSYESVVSSLVMETKERGRLEKINTALQYVVVLCVGITTAAVVAAVNK